MRVLELASLALSVLLLVPSMTFFVQCMAAVLPGRARPGSPASRPRLAVLIPAHDEAAGIAATVKSLLPELSAGDRLVVVADNCTDRTAEVAREAGAHVVERYDPERRGKGYALAAGLEVLAASPPEAVVIIDADCRVEPGSIGRLAADAVAAERPMQGRYLLDAPPGAPSRWRVSAFAILVRNAVRPAGMARLGLPSQLTGSGMAFPWGVIRAASATGGNIVEDLVMGIDLAMKGHAPLHCAEARITSVLPGGDRAAVTQRRRWESGQMATLLGSAPRLLARGLSKRDAGSFALGLDLMVPPLSLLVMLLLGNTLLGGAAVAMGGAPAGARLALGQLGLVVVAVGSAWARFGRRTLRPSDALAMVGYLLWKLPLYASLLRHGRQKAWIRTEREG